MVFRSIIYGSWTISVAAEPEGSFECWALITLLGLKLLSARCSPGLALGCSGLLGSRREADERWPSLSSTYLFSSAKEASGMASRFGCFTLEAPSNLSLFIF
jgi:hypothetical protein